MSLYASTMLDLVHGDIGMNTSKLLFGVSHPVSDQMAKR
jgi:hydrogenase/urease accessory protein HupE